MKTPHLLASFAVATLASAADLPDVSAPGSDWAGDKVLLPAPLTRDLSLRGQSTRPPREALAPLPPVLPDTPRDRAQVPSWGAPKRRTPPGPLIDAPSYRIPEVLPDNLPPGAKAWEYGGQTYWLLPLVPSRKK